MENPREERGTFVIMINAFSKRQTAVLNHENKSTSLRTTHGKQCPPQPPVVWPQNHSIGHIFNLSCNNRNPQPQGDVTPHLDLPKSALGCTRPTSLESGRGFSATGLQCQEHACFLDRFANALQLRKSHLRASKWKKIYALILDSQHGMLTKIFQISPRTPRNNVHFPGKTSKPLLLSRRNLR